jgi:hypothetical protein
MVSPATQLSWFIMLLAFNLLLDNPLQRDILGLFAAISSLQFLQPFPVSKGVVVVITQCVHMSL